ncbi:(2Fe-2S)-binding protein [Synechococcus sp. Nb3U1]|uniref:putative iron-sulfur cluster-binding metallochaperone n=1 Tax=Synechococcus sp. Nb3U1 TaxID=1914529 RepID=UPI001F348E84|nr:(2Fe-2S)-binding protein [Synechococcus sp. Nb3U1]MCF2969965.1 (2Fe-2S)-binding protein [Synechococcus sp. Nb3U1]
MTEFCCPSSSNEESGSLWQRLCPQDGTKGKPVQLITLKSLLVPVALEQLNPATAYGFCPSPNCPVVYFSEQGQTFTTADLKVSVFQKNENDDAFVCYCFGWSRQRIREELNQLGESNSVDIIITHIKAKRCGCQVNNPQGSCCLENVRSVVKQTVEALAK